MLRFATAFILLPFAASAFGQAVVSGPLKSDPAYQAPVTLQVKNTPLPDVIKAIDKQAKLSVEASSSLSDLKLTIFVNALPAGLLLDKIASVLDCTWIKQHDLEILTMPQDKQLARLKFIDLADQALRANADDEAHKLASTAASSATYAEFADAYAQENMANVAPIGGPRHIPVSRGSGPYQAMASPATYAIGLMMAQWSDSDWNSFWSGTVFYTTFHRASPVEDPSSNRAPDPPLFVFARYDVNGDHSLGISQPPQGRIPHRQMSSWDDLNGPLGATEFGKAVLAWPDLSEADKDDAMNARLQDKSGSDGPTEYFIPPPTTMSDQLEGFYKRGGVPIVADGFHASEPDSVKGGTPLAWLKSLQATDHAYVRIEDGVAMVRHGDFWRLRLQEIPEDQIAPMVSRADSLGLMDYANFVASLTPIQQATLVQAKPPVLGFSLEPVQFCLPALAFLGTMQSAPSPDTPILYGSLSGSQQNLFSDAVLESGFTGGNWTGAGPGFDTKRYAFIMKLVPVTDNGKVVPGVSLYFGSSRQDGVSFNVPLTP